MATNSKFKIGDKVAVSSVTSASSVGYLGYYGDVRLIMGGDKPKYYVKSALGSGGAWFTDEELTAMKGE